VLCDEGNSRRRNGSTGKGPARVVYRGLCLMVMQYGWDYIRMSTVLWTPMRRSGVGERI